MMMASSLSSPARHSNAITAARGNRPLMAITLQLSADGTGRGGGAVERSERHHGGVGVVSTYTAINICLEATECRTHTMKKNMKLGCK